VHPPGGIAGGDALRLEAGLERGAQVLLTTPGAGKWYRSAGRPASQRLEFALQDGARLEWLPQENILFDGAESEMQTRVELSADAVFAGWDIVCFGRQARGEQWRHGQLRQGLEVRREGRLLWLERNVLTPGMRAFHAGAGLRSEPVYGSFIVAAGAVPAEVLDQCRQLVPAGTARYGVTALPGVFAARFLGRSAQEARQYFEALWQQLRPWYLARPAQRPRIWNT
jgi:urease accessory protein